MRQASIFRSQHPLPRRAPKKVRRAASAPLRVRAQAPPTQARVLEEYMAGMLEYVCPTDPWGCQGLPIPSLEEQQEVVGMFYQAHRVAPNLYGLDHVLWNMLNDGDYEKAQALVVALSQYDQLMGLIRALIGNP